VGLDKVRDSDTISLSLLYKDNDIAKEGAL